MSNSHNEFFNLIKENGNENNATGMSSYMKNQFAFLGIKTPERRELTRDYFKKLKTKKKIDWIFVGKCFKEEAREFQYIGISYLINMKTFLVEEDIFKIESLILTKSWWDSVDSLSSVVSYLVFTYPTLKELMIQWSINDNMWLRRTSIIHQLLRKADTDTLLLKIILENNLGSNEFFINKAIGWALRDYSKTDPDWVRGFIKDHKGKLSSLSIKEGSKYI